MSASAWYAIVPARAGSVSIPGKNRMTVGEQSLIELAIERALLVTSGDPSRVLVTTDDVFCADVATYMGCTLVHRPPHLAGSQVTVADAVHHAVTGRVPEGSPVAVLQPTSPTLLDDTILEAVAEFEQRLEWDSLATASLDNHLMWSEDRRGIVAPLYSERVNRQDQRDAIWRETGGLMLVRSWTGPGCLVSNSHYLWPVQQDEAIDVDSPLDLVAARAAVAQRTIEWRIVAGQTVGYGHLYRSLALAAEMPHHLHRWIVDGPDEARMLIGNLHPVAKYGAQYETAPDVVVFDCLRILNQDYERARTDNALVVGIELVELPEGVRLDFYIDELGRTGMYPIASRSTHTRFGPAYASTRDEFRAAHLALETGAVESITIPGRILATFGGEDSERVTEAALKALGDTYDLKAVIGPGFDAAYAHKLRSRWPENVIEASDARMSHEMLKAETVITGCGRTIWEAAYLGCSIITIPVNERERSHAFPPFALRLPAHDLDDGTLKSLVTLSALELHTLEGRRARSAASNIDGHGPRRIAWIIDGLIGGLL